MSNQTCSALSGNAADFSRYCFVVRSCLEQEFHEPDDVVATFMEQNRDRLFEMYATSLPAAAAVLALAMEFESSHYAW